MRGCWQSFASFGYSEQVMHATVNGTMSSTWVSKALYVRPTIYLKSNVQILSGEGSSTDPFILG